MKILLSRESKKKLLKSLLEKNFCSSLKELSEILKISKGTLSDWFYSGKRYLPEEIIPIRLKSRLQILDLQKDNWGKIKGGKETYKIISKKYGKSEIKRRQSRGGKVSGENRGSLDKPLNLDLSNKYLLEFYGALLGDGWMGIYNAKKKPIYLIGIAGHLTRDKDYLLYLREIVKRFFDRKGYLKERPRYNCLELHCYHKKLLSFFNQKLNFPVGKKINLKINDEIVESGFDKMKYVIRGIFDTDGSFYLDKDPAGMPYPCISLTMKSPLLLEQVSKVLLNEGFKVSFRKEKYMLTLKGKKQVSKWLKSIGFSNEKHLKKIRSCNSAWIECHPPKVEVVGSNPIRAA